MKRKHQTRSSRNGVAAVEFAVIAPLMIMLTLGMMELGRVVMVQQILVNASREGARLAILPGIAEAEVKRQVSEGLEATAIIGAVVAVTSNQDNSSPDASVTVAVSIPARDVSWIPNPAFTFDTVLSASTTMRSEGQ